MKLTIVLSSILLFANAAYTQKTMKLTGLKDANDNPFTYTGDVLNGKANGKGLAVYSSGDKYYGDFKNGIMNGRGIFLYTDKRAGVGSYVDGKLQGDIVYFSAEGILYVGAYDEGFNGYAKIIKNDNTFIAGYFKKGLQEGRSISTDHYGNLFTGIYENDKRSGPGLQYEPAQKLLFEGTWKDDKWDGKSATDLHSFMKNENFKGFSSDDKILVSYSDGNGNLLNDTCLLYRPKTNERFFGSFKEGYMKHGFHATADSVKYWGGWTSKGGEGYGVYCKTEKYLGAGNFTNGSLNGEAVYIDIASGIIYAGQLTAGKFTGIATRVTKDNTIITGNFITGKLEGKGSLLDSKGIRKEGIFKAGQLENLINITTANGETFSAKPQKLSDALSLLLTQYDNGFYDLQDVDVWGDDVYERFGLDDDYDLYQSFIKLPGSIDNVIWEDFDGLVQYKALMLQTSDAKEAQAKYKLICQQLLALVIPENKTGNTLKLQGEIAPFNASDDKTTSGFKVVSKSGTGYYPSISAIIQKDDLFYKVFITVGDME
jgi:hypothetical protein